MVERARCVNGGWVFGTHVAFPMDPTVRMTERGQKVPCNQLYCSCCQTPVKHMEGVHTMVRLPANLRELYDAVDPELWLDIVELNDPYRLYYCRCCWYSTPALKPVGHLDSNDIDDWACAGHPIPG